MPQTPYGTPIGVAYTHIANAGTTVVKANPGAMYTININSGTAGATLTLYDQTSTTIGTVLIGALNFGTADVLPLRVPYGPGKGGINFKNGLVVVTAGTLDATIAFK